MRLRLSTRFILIVVLIQAMVLLMMVWNSVRLINESHTELLEKSIRDETVLLVNALSPGLAADDRATLLDTLSLLKDNEKLVYAVVYNRENHQLASIGHLPESNKEATNTSGKVLERDIIHVTRNITLAGQPLGTLQAGYTTRSVKMLAEHSRYQNTAIAVMALALLVTATVLAGYYLMQRLQQLEYGARIFSKGTLDYRIPLQGDDEISDVANSFNQMAQNLTETQQALRDEHAALERETAHLQTLLNGVDAVVLEATPDKSAFTYVSQEAENLLGYPVNDWFSPNFWQDRVHPEDRKRVMAAIADNTAINTSYVLDYRMQHQQGGYRWMRSINSIEAGDNQQPVIRGLLLDISDQKLSEQRIIYLAEHDSMTGLLNRRRFQEELEHHIALASRYGYEGGLIFLDLDQFKYINDTLGHQAGDSYLVAVAKTIASVIREVDILGRLGGDEFGVVVSRATKDEITHLSEKLLETLETRRFSYEGITSHISASIGIAMFPTDGNNTTELLARADAAMYAAKGLGRNSFQFYADADEELLKMQDKIEWEGRIRNALEQNLFEMHYQPIIDIQKNEVTHFEALLRMRDPDSDQLIYPGAFLDTAERFGLIRDIDVWVMEHTLEKLKETESENTRIAINLSAKNFGNQDILTRLESAFSEYSINPDRLVIEVTETTAFDNINEAREFIESLRDLGCIFALDDFGVGFATLHYLKHLPVDYIKIDGSFVKGLGTNEYDRIMVKALRDIAKGINILTIAEYVENAATLKILKELGIDMAQGFHIGKPDPDIAQLPAFDRLIASN